MWLDFDIFLVHAAAFQSVELFLARALPKPKISNPRPQDAESYRE